MGAAEHEAMTSYSHKRVKRAASFMLLHLVALTSVAMQQESKNETLMLTKQVSEY